MKNRAPAVAGRFYPANKDELIDEINLFFAKAKKYEKNNLRAVIAPHAGYVFSGQTAANAYNQIDSSRIFKNVFLIGTSHYTHLRGASIYNFGNYLTPIGEVKINTTIIENLLTNNLLFENNEATHLREHSLEVQLPFLQQKLNYDFKIVPIIIGTNNVETIKKIADKIKPYFTDENLFVISTDFAHYPTYEDAKEIDKKTALSILSNKSAEFISYLNIIDKTDIENLTTGICGWSSVLVLLNITENMDSVKYKIIDYQNSGDIIYGDKNKVVGYYAIILDQENK